MAVSSLWPPRIEAPGRFQPGRASANSLPRHHPGWRAAALHQLRRGRGAVFFISRARYTSTVRGLMPNRALADGLLVRPSISSVAISRSRGVRSTASRRRADRSSNTQMPAACGCAGRARGRRHGTRTARHAAGCITRTTRSSLYQPWRSRLAAMRSPVRSNRHHRAGAEHLEGLPIRGCRARRRTSPAPAVAVDHQAVARQHHAHRREVEGGAVVELGAGGRAAEARWGNGISQFYVAPT